MKRTIYTILVLGVAMLSFALADAEQGIGFDVGKKTTNSLKPTTEFLRGLFATEKFDMQQTVGLSFGTGANQFNQYYLNTMAFKVSEPLIFRTTLGIQTQALGSRASGVRGTRLIIPNIGVLYQPNKNLKIEFRFCNTPQFGYEYDSI